LYPRCQPNASWTRLISAICPASSKTIRSQAPFPIPYLRGFEAQMPEVLRGRLRLEPRMNSTALDAYADGSAYVRTEVGWSPAVAGAAPVLNFTVM
jgi:hypothetical protein